MHPAAGRERLSQAYVFVHLVLSWLGCFGGVELAAVWGAEGWVFMLVGVLQPPSGLSSRLPGPRRQAPDAENSATPMYPLKL